MLGGLLNHSIMEIAKIEDHLDVPSQHSPQFFNYNSLIPYFTNDCLQNPLF